MSSEAHFLVDTRLTRLLGETYRSSEAGLKELVDNAWDADAHNVWIALPTPMTGRSLTIRDDGSGMTTRELRGEYLNIASDKRARTGDRTPKLGRKIKGRKGIGKFAGLTVADEMTVTSVAREKRCTLVINKHTLIESGGDLEKVPLPLNEGDAPGERSGTTIELLHLDDRLNFPTSDRLREVLVQEYGREDSFKVYVDGTPLSVDDVPGTTSKREVQLPQAGEVRLHFTISDAKKAPRTPGIVVKVDGKSVGKPQFFGLDDDDDIPEGLLRKLVGEVDLTGLTDFVTADWGAIVENSKAFDEVKEYVKSVVKGELQDTHAREMKLQQARLTKQINSKLERLPEHRRAFAQLALNRILKRFYGESDERIGVIADVALDAMEHDAYWVVLEQINSASHNDVGSFAASLEQFGLLELSTIGIQARHRRIFLDKLDELIFNMDTREADIHRAIETNLWVLGRSFSMVASNETLRGLLKRLFGTDFDGDRATKRPDLLLTENISSAYMLIEFKRPSHPIGRDDMNQAVKYRDDLTHQLPGKRIEVVMIGNGLAKGVDATDMPRDLKVFSFVEIVSAARAELEWIIQSLAR